MDHRPFESVERYAAFVRAQLRFQRRVEALHDLPEVQAMIPDIAERARVSAIEADLSDLGSPVPAEDDKPASSDAVEALGWLYVAEGSTLGAAFLLKEAQKLGLSPERGARHLAPHAEGRGLHWRRFTERLNGADLTDAEEGRAVAGAHAAFAYVRDMIEAEYAGLPAIDRTARDG